MGECAVAPFTATSEHSAMGSYVGNGGVGAGSTLSLSFQFEPKMVVIYKNSYGISNNSRSGGFGDSLGMFLAGSNSFSIYYTDGLATGTVRYTLKARSLTWYVSSEKEVADLQYNKKGETYFWIAVG